jgi:hypothetical protein
MRNHTGHEVDVGIAVWLIDSEGPFLGCGLMDRLLITRLRWWAAFRCMVAASRIRHKDNQSGRDAARKCLSHHRSSAKAEWYEIP